MNEKPSFVILLLRDSGVNSLYILYCIQIPVVIRSAEYAKNFSWPMSL
ncbi:hypothetical protein GCM10007941_29420 [Amphritea balenae]|nr:hypothetical protein GCM10007941_29420 [Amphritea balenae]